MMPCFTPGSSQQWRLRHSNPRYLQSVQLDVVAAVHAVRRSVSSGPGRLVALVERQRRRSGGGRGQDGLLRGRALSVLQDQGVRWRLEARGDAGGAEGGAAGDDESETFDPCGVFIQTEGVSVPVG